MEKKPFYKRWWGVALIALIGVVILGTILEPGEKEKAKEVKEDKPSTSATTTKQDETEPKKVITFAEFDATHTRDTEEKAYIDSPFILKSGEELTADYIMYVDGGYFDYASAVFNNKELARIKLETSASIKEIEKVLGVTFDDSVIVEKTRIGYEIVFDPKFKSDNVHRYPFELD
ncbi:hypothetical protein [Bacillus sp. JJ722]|uniref:hypothetical protein n=1 Tax=Bacillus sp. JJ722 TaxID=3122973 RepID=UPI002FFFC1A8